MCRFQLLLWLFLCFFTTSLHSQTTEEVLNCGAEPLHQHLRSSDASYQKLEDKLELEWSTYAKHQQKSLPPPYTVPIVFHIVHDNGPENISDADVLRSLAFTNQAFANTDYYDQGTGVNTQVQFCLARRTPDNQPTTGINRVVSAEYTEVQATAEDRDLKDLSRWEPREYVNVWVVKEICGLGLGCGVAGYAYYPSAHGRDIDGIVVEARWLTSNEARASVLVHELGHYLGIRHTFDGGCTNDDCTLDGDRVCDTPPDQSKAAVPCSGTANSCSTDTDSGFATDQNDMFINYMDYGYWSCYSAFTQGQADRMHFFLDGRRRSLLSSPGCLDPCPAPVTANFSGGGVTVEIGTTINFVNSSANGSSFTWKVEGLPSASTANFSRLFDAEGNFRITLLVEGTPPLCQPDSMVQWVQVVCPLTAGFDPGGLTTAGVERTFPNLSTLADTYTWRLDGTPISTDQDLTFTFPTPGLFNLCLEAANPWCSEEFCRLLFIRPPPDTSGTPGSGECGESFIFGYQSSFDGPSNGSFNTVLADVSGDYFVGGIFNEQPVVLRLAPDGSIIWQQQIFPFGNRGQITKLLLDQAGRLVGIGNSFSNGGQGGEIDPSFIFRMEPVSGNLLWANQLSALTDRMQIHDLVHHAPGAPYTLIGSILGSGSTTVGAANGCLTQIQTSDGGVVGGLRQYFSDGVATFDRIIWQSAANRFVVSGRHLSPNNSGWLLVAFAENTTLQSGLVLNNPDPLPTTQTLLEDGDDVVFVAGDRTVTTGPELIHLYRINVTGNLTLRTTYQNTELNILTDAAVNPAGYLINSLDPASSGQTLTQTDRNGNILWSRTYSFSQTILPSQFNSNNLAIDDAGGILLAGDRFSGPGQLPTVFKLQRDGTAAADCIEFENRPFTAEPVGAEITAWFSQAQEFELLLRPFGAEPFFLEPASGNCREECPEEEICDNQIDDDGDGLIDCQDDDLAQDCCCLPEPTISLGADESFCGPVQRNFTAARFDTLFLFGSSPDTIIPDPTLNDLVRLNFTEPGTYRLLAIDTCGRTAADTLTLHPRPRPTLEIGPDTTLCSNAVIPLRAQPGFDEYEWVDGTAEPEFTAFEEGVYWVRATDSCGAVQSDTMRVNIDPTTVIELGPDTLICPGDTITFTLSGFSNYQWSQSSFIDCFNCPEVRFAPTSDTLLVVAGEQGPGCIASDSIRVRIASTVGAATSSDLCSGDTLIIGNQIVTTSGRYFDTIPSGNCFRIDTIVVNLLADTLVRDTVSICAGDSTVIFGNFESQTGTYTQSFPRSNGCDSLRETLLVVNDTFFTVQTLSICAGDSALIFGQFETQAGSYLSVFSAVNGCDSTMRVDLEVNQVSIQTSVQRDACLGANAGAGEVQVSNGLAPFTILWSTGDTTTQVAGLEPGDYGVTVIDANGCSASASLPITEGAPPALVLATTNETCPGANDGTLLVSGELTGQTLTIDGRNAGIGPFYDNLAPEAYVLVVIDSLGCNQTLPFTIEAATASFLELPPDQTIPFGDSITLVPSTNAADLSALTWSAGGATLCVGCPTLTLRPESDLTVIASLPDTADCAVTDTTMIRVMRDDLVYIPNAFSPNTDGVNDDFRVFTGPAVDDILRFAVYDRWGGQVFLRENVRPTDALAGWDGTLPNRLDPAVGVYVYLVEVRLFNGEVVKIAGEVLVLR